MRDGSTKVNANIVIIGAGVIGSSLAMHLAKLGEKSIHVVDLDLEGSKSSSELNAGGVRATWLEELNVTLSKESILYFERVKDEVGFKPKGYLWLQGSENVTDSEKMILLAEKHRWSCELWDVDELRRRIPFLDKTDDLERALFSPRDGLINPNLLKNHFRQAARRLGVEFHDRLWFDECIYRGNGSGAGAELKFTRLPPNASPEAVTELFETGRTRETRIDSVVFEANAVVNCGGPWASSVAKRLGYPCDSYSVRRQISLFDCKSVDMNDYGMIIDPSGVYFHAEADHILGGYADPGEAPGVNFHYDGEEFFQEKIWAPLHERSTHFESLKHVGGWAGLYDVSPDGMAILGRVDQGAAGSFGRVFEVHSFSGRGLMQSYSAGLGLAELMVEDRFLSMDLSSLSSNRFRTGNRFSERLVI